LAEFGLTGRKFIWIGIETEALSAPSRQFELLQTFAVVVECSSNSVTIYAPADCGYSIPGLWPLIQHSRPLPNGQSDPPPVLNRLCEDISCLVEIVAAVQQTVDLRAVLCPLLDLVEVADIRNQRVNRSSTLRVLRQGTGHTQTEESHQTKDHRTKTPPASAGNRSLNLQTR